MIEFTPYIQEEIAAFIGNFGFVLMMLGYCAWFAYPRKNALHYTFRGVFGRKGN